MNRIHGCSIVNQTDLLEGNTKHALGKLNFQRSSMCHNAQVSVNVIIYVCMQDCFYFCMISQKTSACFVTLHTDRFHILRIYFWKD